MAPYAYRPASQASHRSRRLAENPSHPGRSPQVLEAELMALQQEVQRVYAEIQRAKSGWSLLYFLLCPPLRLRHLQEVAALRHRIQSILDRIRDLKEQQVALLFLDCWSEELAAVPASVLLGEPQHATAQQQALPVTEGERHDA